MVVRVKGQEPQAGQIAQGEAEGAGGVLAKPVEKPAISLGDDGQRRKPSPGRVSEQARRRLMIVIRPVEEGDERAAVDEDRFGPHGRTRP